MDIFNFSLKIKKEYPEMPIVFLAQMSRELNLFLEKEDLSFVDYIFSWLGNANI